VGRRATNPARKRRRPWEEITPDQYRRGWELVSTGHTIQAVVAATGLTKPQLAWLMKVGDESRGMISYHSRIAEEVAAIRSRAQRAAEYVGAEAPESLRRSIEITKTAQTYAREALEAFMAHRVRPALKKIRKGEGSDEDLQNIALPKGLRESLKVIRPYTDFSETAKAFRMVYESPHQSRDPLSQLPKEVRLDLSGESQLPAMIALVEEVDRGDVGHDVLDDLLPEYKGWNAEEIEHYLETGERPARDYGDEPAKVIDVTPEKEPEEDEEHD